MLLLLLNQHPPYYKTLIATANAHIDREPEVATVVAFMACEIVAEQVFSIAFQFRGIGDLEELVTGFVRGNSLTKERNRDLYVALTNDRIQDQPFWPKLCQAAKIRNDAVHHGARVTTQQARDACDAVQQVVAHLEKVGERLSESIKAAGA